MPLYKLHNYKQRVGGLFDNRRVRALEDAYNDTVNTIADLEAAISTINANIVTINNNITTVQASIPIIRGKVYAQITYADNTSSNNGEWKINTGDAIGDYSSHFSYSSGTDELYYEGDDVEVLITYSMNTKMPSGTNDVYIKTGNIFLYNNGSSAIEISRMFFTSGGTSEYVTVSKSFKYTLSDGDLLTVNIDPANSGGTWRVEDCILTITDVD